MELKNVSARYGEKTILENISLKFEGGRIYTLLGKNGCGKSTLMKICADMLPVSRGELMLMGKSMREYTPHERALNISYLSQHRNIANISVERLIMHGRHPHMTALKKTEKRDWEEIDRVMKLMEVYHLRDKPLAAISGGERQRVYIAMLLAQDTPVMLLDEPTTYMDIAYQLSFLRLAQELKKQGKLIIMVLHDIDQALRISDEILLMDKGEIAYKGSPEEIIDSRGLERVFQISVRAVENGEHCCYRLYLA